MEKKKIENKITAILLLVFLAVYALVYFFPRGENTEGENRLMKKDGEMPILIAHGGGNGEFPDNTLEAFYNAYSVDKNVMMETDVSITKDGVVILSHNTNLDRRTNVTGDIADWNYSDLIADRVNFGYDNDTEDTILVGERARFKNDDGIEVTPLDVEYPEGVFPRDREIFLATTFDELLSAFPDNMVSVEIKQKGEDGIRALDATLEVIRKHEAFDRVTIATFNHNVYKRLSRYQKNGKVPEGVMYTPSLMTSVKYTALYYFGLDLFFGDKISAFHLPMEELGVTYAKREIIENMHRHNIAIHFWTIDDESEMRQLIELGADGIMTNYPHKLKAVYEEYVNNNLQND